MKKRIILGSIVSVVILIGVSFTATVGVKTAAPDTTTSPLFEIRRQGTTDDARNEITSEYIGKQKGITLPLPTIDDTAEILKRVILVLKRIDERTYKKLFEISPTHYASKVPDLDFEKKELSLFFDTLKDEEERKPIPPTYFTCFGSEPFACVKDIIEMILSYIGQFFYLLLLYIFSCLKTTLPTIS